MLLHITIAKVVQKVGIKIQTKKEFVIDVQAANIKHLWHKRPVIRVPRVCTKPKQRRLLVSIVGKVRIKVQTTEYLVSTVQAANIKHLRHKRPVSCVPRVCTKTKQQ